LGGPKNREQVMDDTSKQADRFSISYLICAFVTLWALATLNIADEEDVFFWFLMFPIPFVGLIVDLIVVLVVCIWLLTKLTVYALDKHWRRVLSMLLAIPIGLAAMRVATWSGADPMSLYLRHKGYRAEALRGQPGHGESAHFMVWPWDSYGGFGTRSHYRELVYDETGGIMGANGHRTEEWYHSHHINRGVSLDRSIQGGEISSVTSLGGQFYLMEVQP
jgi:hypothetical protein